MTCHRWRQCEEEFVQHEILSWGSPCTRSTGWGQHYGHNGHSGQLVRRNAAVVTSREHARAHQLAEISRVNSVINTLVVRLEGLVIRKLTLL